MAEFRVPEMIGSQGPGLAVLANSTFSDCISADRCCSAALSHGEANCPTLATLRIFIDGVP